MAVFDSAGTRIVELPPRYDSQLPEWEVPATPFYSLGQVSGSTPTLFADVRGATRLSNGTVVVLDGGSQELRFFDSDGQHRQSVGGEGDGPSEFRSARWITRSVADSILVLDPRTAKVVWFDPDGDLTRSERATQIRTFHDGALLIDGGIVSPTFGDLAEPRVGDLWRPEGVVILQRPGSQVVDTLGAFRGSQQLWGVPGLGSPVEQETFLARGWPPTFLAVGDTEGTIRVFSREGRHTLTVRWAGPPLHAPDHLLSDWRSTALARLQSAPFISEAEEVAGRTASVPMPRFADLEVDVLGCIWLKVVEHQIDASDSDAWDAWIVLSQSGRPIARVPILDDLTIFEIGEDYILGMSEDDLDVQYINIYRLGRLGSVPFRCHQQ